MPKGVWDIQCHVCGQPHSPGPPHGTTCFKCEAAGYKYCVSCKKVKPVSEFYRRPDTGKYMTKCSSCYKHSRNQQAAADREIYEYVVRRNQQSRECKQRRYATPEGKQHEIDRCHARRAALRGHVAGEQWSSCLEYFQHSCAYCGSTGPLTVDHIIPVSRFGANKIYNVVPACGACNSSKCDHDILDWYPKQSFYTETRLLKIHSWFKDMQKEVM